MNRKQVMMALLLMVAAITMAPLATAQQTGVAYTASGSLTATSASCTATACVAMPVVAGAGSVAWQITGTFVGTITFEASVDGTNFVTAAVVPVGTTRTLAGTATAGGVWQQNVAGYTSVRARCSAFTSGTIVVTGKRSAGHPPAQ